MNTEQKIISMVAEQFGLDENTLTRDTSFEDDIEADSLDVIELTMAVEDIFKLSEISDDDLKQITTLGHLVDYVEKATE